MNNSPKDTFRIPTPTTVANAKEAEFARQMNWNAAAATGQPLVEYSQPIVASQSPEMLREEDAFDSEIRRLADAAYLQAIGAGSQAEQPGSAFEAAPAADVRAGAAWPESSASAAIYQESLPDNVPYAAVIEEAKQYATPIERDGGAEVIDCGALLIMMNNLAATRDHALGKKSDFGEAA